MLGEAGEAPGFQAILQERWRCQPGDQYSHSKLATATRPTRDEEMEDHAERMTESEEEYY